MSSRLKAAALGSSLLLACGTAPVRAAVMLRDYETAVESPSVWVVNIPNENATVRLSPDHPHDGLQCLKLHYHFVSTGGGQYLGVPNKIRVQGPAQQLRFWLRGDNSKASYGIQVSDAFGETHQFGKNTGQGGIIDFEGWKEVVIDLAGDHETWGGDNNGKLDYPITAITFMIGQPMDHDKPVAAEGDLAFDSLSVDTDKSAAETLGGQIAVTTPAYGSNVRGDTAVKVTAPGFTGVTVRCWKPGGAVGSDSVVASVVLDAQGDGSFDFPADTYPHGPVTVRISGEVGSLKDNCYLQLYNQGGVSWNEGIPKDPPPAAKGMTLVFADDFDGPLAISSSDPKATYYDHKPPGGWQDFSKHTFSSHDSPKDPFSQVDTYLRIRASDQKQSSGLISSLKNDASGITAKAPCYFECRFLGPNAIGTWPAFWLLTDYMSEQVKGHKVPCDELDIIEAYGGEGPGSPNAFDTYMLCPHAWDQGATGKTLEKTALDGLHNPVRMGKSGIPASWYAAFHIYGCKITAADTIYYCDNIEVGRHQTLPLSREQPFFFLINLATGGGWPVDLSRYNGQADMYVDYVRVYQQGRNLPSFSPAGSLHGER